MSLMRQAVFLPRNHQPDLHHCLRQRWTTGIRQLTTQKSSCSALPCNPTSPTAASHNPPVHPPGAGTACIAARTSVRVTPPACVCRPLVGSHSPSSPTPEGGILTNQAASHRSWPCSHPVHTRHSCHSFSHFFLSRPKLSTSSSFGRGGLDPASECSVLVGSGGRGVGVTQHHLHSLSATAARVTSLHSSSVIARGLCPVSTLLQRHYFRGGKGANIGIRQLHDSSGPNPKPRVAMATSEGGNVRKAPDLSPEDLQIRRHLQEIFLTAVEAVMPKSLLEKEIHFNPKAGLLTVRDRSFTVHRNVFVVGFGKGVAGMARIVEDMLGDHIIRGILSVPVGASTHYRQDILLKPGSKISMREGAQNNLPDAKAMATAKDIEKLVSNLTAKDIVIVLISGGGSSLLPYPRDPLVLGDVVTATRELFGHGGNICDVNTVRRHLEVLKGGGLAHAAMPAEVISLIISDVIGDSLELIASGPTVRQTHSPQRCLEVIDSLGARPSMPAPVLNLLESETKMLARQARLTAHPLGKECRKVEEDDQNCSPMDWSRVYNVLLGSNAVACQAALHCAQQLGCVGSILTTTLSGDARTAGQLLAGVARFVWTVYQARQRACNKELVQLELQMAKQGISKHTLNEICSKALMAYNSNMPFCVVAGGETTVNVTGRGKGGRNQEMVLAAGMELHRMFQGSSKRKSQAEVFFLSAGSDGQDGPTEAAGAVVDENFMVDARAQGLDPLSFLDNNDTFSLWTQFAAGRDHVITGLTGTNVMDIHIIIVTGQRNSH